MQGLRAFFRPKGTGLQLDPSEELIRIFGRADGKTSTTQWGKYFYFPQILFFPGLASHWLLNAFDSFKNREYEKTTKFVALSILSFLYPALLFKKWNYNSQVFVSRLFLQKGSGLLRIDTPSLIPFIKESKVVSVKDVVLKHHYPLMETLPEFARDKTQLFIGHGNSRLYILDGIFPNRNLFMDLINGTLK